MLLKIYLGVSIITFICLVLTNLSILNRAINKYGDKIEQNAKQIKKKDRAGLVLVWLKILIASFIPVINIVMLLTVIFVVDKVVKKSDEYVEQALKENGIE